MQTATELVLSLCRSPVPSTQMERAREALRHPIDWDDFFVRAKAWQVEPLVMINLQKYFHEVIPPAVLDLARERERGSRAIALARTLALADLTSRFDESGIPVIVLKGPAAGITAYGDPSLRSFSDGDLLVHRGDLVRARDKLIAMGYSRDYDPESESHLLRKEHALEFSRASAKVELHSTLMSKHLRFGLDPSDIWEQATSTPCPGGEFKVLAPHHAFVYACAHGTKHEWVGLHWICDIAQLAERLDEVQAGKVLALADALNVRRILALGLRVARDVVGVERSPFSDSDLVPERDTQDLVETAKLFFGGNDAGGGGGRRRLASVDPNLELLLYWISARERPLDRISSLAHVVFVPTDKDRGPLSWISRPMRLGMRAVRQLGRVFSVSIS